MPNWCENRVTFDHEDPKERERLVRAVKSETLFNEFVPNPEGEWDYGWSVENWGTKWEANFYDYDPVIDEDNSIYIDFDTAWSPPIEFYNAMLESGWDIAATYYEPGMSFVGSYKGGIDECHDIEDDIPKELDEEYGISDYRKQMEEEEEEAYG